MPPPTLPHKRSLTEADFARARESVAPLQQALTDSRARIGPDSFTVAWMSDLHLLAPRPYGGDIGFYADQVDCTANLRIALAELATLDPLPDLLVFGGDVAESGCGGEAPTDEYAEFGGVLRDCLPSGLPTLAIPGNHDHADAPLSADWHRAWHAASPNPWPLSPDPDDYYFVHRLGGWRIIGLDSRQEHLPSARQKDWLSHELKSDASTPTLVLIHRPLLTVGNWVDDFRLKDRDTFDILDAAPAVRTIWSGHAHLPRAWSYRKKKHVIFPSVACGMPGPCGWGVGVFGRDQLETLLIKPVVGPWFDCISMGTQQTESKLESLNFENYTADRTFNPCFLPRESAKD